jgi:hypothetical protein
MRRRLWQLIILLALPRVLDAQGLEFFTLPPCRLVDTRELDGPFGGPTLRNGTPRVFGVGGHCGVPSSAVAIAVNLTAIHASAAGHLTLSAAGITTGSSTINFSGGAIRANNAVLGLADDGTAAFAVMPVVQNNGEVDMILDVSGYFRRPCGSAPPPPPPGATPATLCTSADANCSRDLDFAGCKLHYFRSYDLDGYNPGIVRAVIAVHGVGRNHAGQFTTVLEVVGDASKLDEVLVIAPLFPDGPQSPTELGWTSYQSGGNGTCSSNLSARVSSFAVGDAFIDKLGNRALFPNLRDIVVIGHSGGGQFSGRYAAANLMVGKYPCLRFKFVPTNPSSWIYLNENRNVAGQGWTSSGPQFDACSSYNRYSYGLEGLQGAAYIGQFTAADIRENWRSRHVVYFVGENDTCVPDPGGPAGQCDEIDFSCAAMLQGDNRFHRAESFYDSVQMYFPPRPGSVHEFSVASGIGHSSSGMYRSPNGRQHILE